MFSELIPHFHHTIYHTRNLSFKKNLNHSTRIRSICFHFRLLKNEKATVPQRCWKATVKYLYIYSKTWMNTNRLKLKNQKRRTMTVYCCWIVSYVPSQTLSFTIHGVWKRTQVVFVKPCTVGEFCMSWREEREN